MTQNTCSQAVLLNLTLCFIYWLISDEKKSRWRKIKILWHKKVYYAVDSRIMIRVGWELWKNRNGNKDLLK